MNKFESEYYDHEKNDTWPDLYVEINASSTYHSKDEALKVENSNLNRYINVAPYDQSRIKLSRTPQDYINASLIKVPQAKRSYILTQGPLANTVAHFWVMIWEQDSRAIIMLNKLIEKSTPKCEFYWPEGKGDKAILNFKDVKLTVKFVSSHKRRKNFVVREFLLTDHVTDQSRTIIQFHYTEWPDFGQPSSPVSFLKLLAAVRSSGALDHHGPPVVHCSAGIGRSGTFCLIDSVLCIVENTRSTKGIIIKDILLEMRKHRAGLIQTSEQLRFSYMAIIYATKLLNLESDQSSTSKHGQHKRVASSPEGANNGSSATNKSTKRPKAPVDQPNSLIEALEHIDSDDEDFKISDNSARIEPPHVKIAKQSTTLVLTNHGLRLSPPSDVTTKTTSPATSTTPNPETNSSKEYLDSSSKIGKQDKNSQQKKSPNANLRPSNLALENNAIGQNPPLPSPGQLLNQPLLGQKSCSDDSFSGTNILQRRRERELRNQRLAERTRNIRENMRNNEGRAEEHARKWRFFKKASVTCSIAVVVFGSAIYLYYKSYFSN